MYSIEKLNDVQKETEGERNKRAFDRVISRAEKEDDPRKIFRIACEAIAATNSTEFTPPQRDLYPKV